MLIYTIVLLSIGYIRAHAYTGRINNKLSDNDIFFLYMKKKNIKRKEKIELINSFLEENIIHIKDYAAVIWFLCGAFGINLAECESPFSIKLSTNENETTSIYKFNKWYFETFMK